MDELGDSYKSFLRENALALVIGAVGVICLGYGLIYYFGSQTPTSDIEFEAGAETAEASEEKAPKGVLVDVAGAVVKPGVYGLTKDARLKDAISAAGGFTSNANTDLIAREMNLAVKLTDGAKIYIPFVGEQSVRSASTQAGSIGQQGELININTASASQLESLPGIGTVTAAKIIENRPFASIDELREKSVLSAKVFDQVKEKISVY